MADALPPGRSSPFQGWRNGLLVTGLLLGAAGLGLAWWIPSEEELARRAGDTTTAQLGVPVHVGSLHWQLFPAPSVVLRDLRTDQPQPILVDQLRATLRTAALWRGAIELTRLEVDGATVPQLSLSDLGTANGQPAAVHLAPTAPRLDHLQIRNLHWISRTGRNLVYEGEADFDPGWRPRTLQLRRPDAKTPASLSLTRQDGADHWHTQLRLGGGTADGEVTLQIEPGGMVRLHGQLDPKGIEVLSALEAIHRNSPVSGKASGHTQLSAEGMKFGELVRSLHTRTSFSMAPATLLRFDLDRAVRTMGKEHAGTTRLDTLTGEMDTQNTAKGIVVGFTALKAHSGVLTATGEATLAQQHVDAAASVDLVDGLVGVPLRVQGPVSALQVSVPSGAVAGAAVGTAVMPGIGTAIGARIGAAIGKLFGRDAPASAPAPARSAKPAP